jgi:hypothetical protein
MADLIGLKREDYPCAKTGVIPSVIRPGIPRAGETGILENFRPTIPIRIRFETCNSALTRPLPRNLGRDRYTAFIRLRVTGP